MQIETTQINNLMISGYSEDYVFNTIKNMGTFYESAILEKWTPYIAAAKIILDIGANLGNHTLYWASHLPKASIYSFEPYKPNFDLLEKNILENKLTQVLIFNLGVGSRNGTAGVKSMTADNFGSVKLSYTDEEIADNSISMITIDEFCCQQEVPCVDFVKIDTEGFEIQVLEGMLSTLAMFSPDLWIEATEETVETILTLTEKVGYIVIDVEGANILLLNSKRHTGITPCGKDVLLKKMLYFLERTNDYYQNYTTAKKWVDAGKEKLDKLQASNESLNQKYRDSVGNYERLNNWYQSLQKKYELAQDEFSRINKSLQEQNSQLQSELEEGSKELTDLKRQLVHITDELSLVYQEDINDIQLFEEIKRIIQKQETQTTYLKAENAELRRKLSLITDTRLGQFALKIYRWLMRVGFKIH